MSSSYMKKIIPLDQRETDRSTRDISALFKVHLPLFFPFIFWVSKDILIKPDVWICISGTHHFKAIIKFLNSSLEYKQWKRNDILLKGFSDIINGINVMSEITVPLNTCLYAYTHTHYMPIFCNKVIFCLQVVTVNFLKRWSFILFNIRILYSVYSPTYPQVGWGWWAGKSVSLRLHLLKPTAQPFLCLLCLVLGHRSLELLLDLH